MEDRKPRPNRVWNRISDEIRDKVIEQALEEPELSPREVAVAFTDAEKTFVSEASVYRILKAEGLVTSPAFFVMKAAEAFTNPTTAINQLWQTDFTLSQPVHPMLNSIRERERAPILQGVRNRQAGWRRFPGCACR